MIGVRLERTREPMRWSVRPPRLSPRVALPLVVLAAILAGAWFWVRDSSLVAVTKVTVSVQAGPDSARIRSALVVAAHNMTTLHVRMDALRSAVAPYPVVKDLRVDTQFPHRMGIQVIEQVPVAAVSIGGRTVAVSADGTLLHGLSDTHSLALIPLKQPPGGTTVTDPTALGAIRLLAAAPYQLLARVSQLDTNSRDGFIVQLRNGPSVYFGDPGHAAAKWIAASEVLADPTSAGASYIDVSDPERPAAGATSPATGGTSSAAGTSAGSASSASSGGQGEANPQLQP